MARRRLVQTMSIRDFSGLNYNADSFQLGEGQVADCVNVDFDPSGGFARRDNVQAYNDTWLGGSARNGWTYVSANGTYRQLIVQKGNDAQVVKSGGAHTAINPDALTTAGDMYAATAGDKCYIQRNAEQVPFTWNGTATAVMADTWPIAGPAFQDDYAVPSGGHMPKAKYVCMHHTSQMLFHANLLEGTATQVAKRSRIRFSHPSSDLTATYGFESYRTNDWIDVGADDGDVITGLCSWGDRLLIFKHNSVWELRGYSADSFSLHNVSKTVGATSQKAIAVGDEGVYFFSWPNGLQLYDGTQIKDLWYPMTPLTAPAGYGTTYDQVGLSATAGPEMTVGYVNQRVWVSGTLSGGSANGITFVFDPRIGKGGGWTRYDLGLGAFITLAPPGDNRTWYAIGPADSTGWLLQLHNGQTTDRLSWSNHATPGAAPVQSPVTAWCLTKFYDLDNSAQVKRWKHPILVCDAVDTMMLSVDIYRDYSLQSIVRHFDVNITGLNAGGVWGDPWGFIWGGTSGGPQSIEKGGLLGRGTAIAVKVNGPLNGVDPWAVNAITFKFIPRRIRS